MPAAGHPGVAGEVVGPLDPAAGQPATEVGRVGYANAPGSSLVYGLQITCLDVLHLLYCTLIAARSAGLESPALCPQR